MNYNEFIRSLIEALGMNPDGALIGSIGAVIAVIGKVNGYTWKASLVIVIGGFCLSGYGLPAISENWEMKEGTQYFLVFLVGFLSNHIYVYLDTLAPKMFAIALEYVKKRLKLKK